RPGWGPLPGPGLRPAGASRGAGTNLVTDDRLRHNDFALTDREPNQGVDNGNPTSVRSVPARLRRGQSDDARREPRPGAAVDSASGPLPPEGQGPVGVHQGGAPQGQSVAALRRHPRLRGTEAGPARPDEGDADQGRRGTRRLGHGEVPVPRPAGGVRQYSSIFASHRKTEQQLWTL